MNLLFFFVGAVVFGGISYKLRWLTGMGSVTASAFGFCLLWLGGIAWVVPLIVFFGTSSMLSKVGKRGAKKVPKGKKSEDIRNAVQVLANGGIAWIMLILHALTEMPIWYSGFIGALAAATADTWATEIGRLAGGRPRSILSGKLLEQGLSGGITWQGTGGSVAGALLIGLSCVPFYDNPLLFCLFLGLVPGMSGSLMDSVLGAALQVKYRVVETGQVVETAGDQESTEQLSGVAWMNNDLVNVFCTMSGGAVALLIDYLIL